MGFDIGTHLCIRRPGHKLDYLGPDPFVPRNSGLFGLMAGVSGPVVLFEPRGVPDDADGLLLHELRDEPSVADGVARSWLTTAEVRDVAETYESHPVLAERATNGRPRVPAHFAATLGAMEAVDRWCGENGGGHAILAFSIG